VAFSRVLRGPGSLGALLEAEGHPSVPSDSTPAPLVGEPYFNGGYSTNRHGCISGTTGICGVQIEHDSTVKVPQSVRADYATGLVRAYETYLAQNFGYNLGTGRNDIMIDDDNANNDSTRARFAAAGGWTTAQPPQRHLNGVRLADSAAVADSATFSFYVDTPGTYKVYAWWPSAAAHSASVPYRVYAANGAILGSVAANQQAGGGQWNLLGTYTLQAGWGTVRMARGSAGPGTLAADAIRVVEQ
jgi:hypothetical protein